MNVKELTSIVDYKRFNPALDPVAFPNVGIETYLSTTPRYGGQGSPMNAYWVGTYRGEVHQLPVTQSHRLFNLRLVRRGRE